MKLSDLHSKHLKWSSGYSACCLHPICDDSQKSMTLEMQPKISKADTRMRCNWCVEDFLSRDMRRVNTTGKRVTESSCRESCWKVKHVSAASSPQMKSFIPLSSPNTTKCSPSLFPLSCSRGRKENQMWSYIVLINLRSKLSCKDRLPVWLAKLKTCSLGLEEWFFTPYFLLCFQVEGNLSSVV